MPDATKKTSSKWVFMDAGDTFIYGYPTLYEALRDCFRLGGQEMDLPSIRLQVQQYMKENPPLNLNAQTEFTDYFESLYSAVLLNLKFQGELQSAVDSLWEDWKHARRLRLFDDSRPALQRLRNLGFRLAVISNWDDTFHNTLKQLEVDEFFDIALCSIELGISKPDPKIFHHALDLAQPVIDPVWYLGDQIEMDIRPANELGMNTILVDYYAKHEENGIADYYAPSMSVAVMHIEQNGHSKEG